MSEHEPKENLVEYRLRKLEDAVSSLVELKEVVLRWDARFQAAGNFLNCPLHQQRMDNLEKAVEEQKKETAAVKEEVSKIKKFVYTINGGLVVISIIIQLAGPMLLDKISGKPQPDNAIHYIVPSTNSIPHK